MTNKTNLLLRRLGKNIRTRRTDTNLSQAALAAAVRISVSHLSAVERGERSASVLCLTRIAKTLQTTTEKLCEAIDDETRQQHGNQAK